MRAWTTAARWLAVALLILAGGCGSGDDDAPPPNADVSGSWSGTWQSGQGAGGSLRVVFSGRGVDAFGANRYGVDLFPSCGPEDHAFGTNSATTIQNSVSFSVLFADGIVGIGLLFVQGTFSFQGTVDGNQIRGSYRRIDDTCQFCECTLGSSGSWSVSR